MASLTLDPRFKSDLIFNDVSKHFITLKDRDMHEYNIHLKTVLNIFIDNMKEKDSMFKACYQRIAHVGSYYEGLKVGKPEEFDLNIIIALPINYSALTILVASERPGYIKLKANPDVLPNLRKHPRWSVYNGGSTCQPGVKVMGRHRYYSQTNRRENHQVQANFNQTSNHNSTKKSRKAARQKRRYRKKVMDKWFDQNMYLDQNKFRHWFESVVSKALQSYQYVGGKYILQVNEKTYLLHHKKSGPAWTLKIDVPNGHTVDVDLVPVLEFQTPPLHPFLNHNTKKQNWFAISKPLDGRNNNILWRPSFYERELEILKGSIKQVIRQMKKLRDTQNFKSIASYYIKTLFLHELNRQDSEFQKFPATFLFYHMLKQLHEACSRHKIYDFWNPTNNLLGNISSTEMLNITSRLNRIVKDIDRKIDTDPYIIAEYILTTSELSNLKLVRSMASISLKAESKPSLAQTSSNSGLARMWNTFWNMKEAEEPAMY